MNTLNYNFDRTKIRINSQSLQILLNLSQFPQNSDFLKFFSSSTNLCTLTLFYFPSVPVRVQPVFSCALDYPGILDGLRAVQVHIYNQCCQI